MGFGNYDEQEHERREEKMDIDTAEPTSTADHEGTVTTEGSDDTDALLDQLDDIQSD